MGLYRFTARNDPRDGTARVLAREASGDQPAVYLDYDPEGTLDPVELTDEEAARVSQFVALTPADGGEVAPAAAEAAPARAGRAEQRTEGGA